MDWTTLVALAADLMDLAVAVATVIFAMLKLTYDKRQRRQRNKR